MPRPLTCADKQVWELQMGVAGRILVLSPGIFRDSTANWLPYGINCSVGTKNVTMTTECVHLSLLLHFLAQSDKPWPPLIPTLKYFQKYNLAITYKQGLTNSENKPSFQVGWLGDTSL
jgi:hypothetical protein